METVEQLAERIAGHAYERHVVEQREFQDPKYGEPMPVETREEFRQHIIDVLESKQTLCCTTYSTVNVDAKGDIFYHPPTNTLIAVPENPENEPTAYRPWDHQGHFYMKLGTSADAERRSIAIAHSIYELRPELAAAREAQRIKEEDEKLRETIEQRFLKERGELIDRQQAERRHSGDPQADAKRHALELKELEEGRERDFERHRREREAARLVIEREQRESRTLREGPELGRGRTR